MARVNGRAFRGNRRHRERLVNALARKDKQSWFSWRCRNRFARVDLRGIDLHDRDLAEVALGNVDFTGANLHGVHLCYTHFDGANLTDADLSECAFSYRSFFKEATMIRTNLRESRFMGFVFDGADMREADLTDTYLATSEMRRVNLRGARVARKQLLEAYTLFGARLDPGVRKWVRSRRGNMFMKHPCMAAIATSGRCRRNNA